MSSDSKTIPQKLPFWHTVGAAYLLWAKNLPELVRISWLWLVVMLPVLTIINWWQAPYFLELLRSVDARVPPPDPVFGMLVQVIDLLIMLPMLASIAVAWHRLLLRGEHAGAGTYFRLDGIVIGYAVVLLLLGLLSLVPQFLEQILEINKSNTASGLSVVSILLSIVSIVVLLIAARLSVILPARALGQVQITPGMVWTATQKNTWRLFGGYILTGVVVGFATGMMLFAQSWFGSGRTTFTLVWTALTFLWVLGGMIGVGFLSLAYRHFFERDRTAR
jgi:hypothetical protein